MVEYPPLARSTSVQRGNGIGWDRLHALMLLSRCRMHAMLAERKAPNRPSRSSRCQHEEAMATKSMDPWHQLAGSPSRRREPIAHIAVRNAPHGHISQAAPCTRPARALHAPCTRPGRWPVLPKLPAPVDSEKGWSQQDARAASRGGLAVGMIIPCVA